ncbi:aminoglycoside phosphotransferase family protein [Kribbella sp. NPDC049584]|uniref:phosphotransferase family protein n=1 Tax=Kribbella sp. NPDC049584 TaxID=3154833 RepID=UPI003434A3F3
MPEHHDFLHQVAAVARRHGVDPEHVKEVAGGVANRAFILGDDLFLRASRPGYEDDLRKETHVVPAARLVGVLTPEILEYDETHRLLAAPYVVVERIHGAEPTEAPTGLADELARLHQLEHAPADAPAPQDPDTEAQPADTPAPRGLRTEAQPGGAPGAPRVVEGTGGRKQDAPGVVGDLWTEARPGDRRRDGRESRPRRALDLPGVPEDDWGDPWRTVDDLATRGYVDPATARWLSGWFTRLAERFDDSGPKVLIHGDVATHNLLAGPDNELRALIDWGDAAWAPRAMEFAKLPLTQVAKILPAYAAQSPTPEEDLAAAILWFHLSWALAKLPAPPWPAQHHWTAPTTSRLLNILHFFTTTPPPPWPDLT